MGDEPARRTGKDRDDLIRRQQEDIARLREELVRAARQHRAVERERDRLQQQNARLKQQLDMARRAGFRQAAPFAKDRPQGRGGRPGRRAGIRYGRRARRVIPSRVDVTYPAPLPTACPNCGGAIRRTRVAPQYQARISDLPVVPYRQDQSPRPDFWGSDVRNHTTEDDTRWVNYSTRRFSSRSTAF